MLTNKQNIVQQSELRKNLSASLARVSADRPIYISSRGIVKYKVSMAHTPDPRKVKTRLHLLEEVRKEISQSKIKTLDTTNLIRKKRDERTKYLLLRDGKNI